MTKKKRYSYHFNENGDTQDVSDEKEKNEQPALRRAERKMPVWPAQKAAGAELAREWL